MTKVIVPSDDCDTTRKLVSLGLEATIICQDEIDGDSDDQYICIDKDDIVPPTNQTIYTESYSSMNGFDLSAEEINLILMLRAERQKQQEKDQNIISEFKKTENEYTAISSPLLLKNDCSRIISNNIFTISFSCACGIYHYSESEYAIYFTDINGNPISSIVKYKGDMAETDYSPQFELNSGISFSKKDTYFLVIIEENGGKSSIVNKNEFHIDITFAQDYDFGF